MGYRYQPSFRHFIGTVEQTQREVNHNQIENIYHLLDFCLERELTSRWSVVASVPVLFAHRNHCTRRPVSTRERFRRCQRRGPHLDLQTADGIGRQHFGRHESEDSDRHLQRDRPCGQRRQARSLRRPINRSRPATAARVSRSISRRSNVLVPQRIYFAGVYLFNPRDTNGVSTSGAPTGKR